MPASKADRVEKQRRIEQAVIALLDGATVQSVVRSFSEEYGIAEKTAYEYTKEATDRIHQKIDDNISHHISKQYNRLERLYNKAVKNNDLRTARMIMKDMADLLGLDAPKRTDITSGGEPMKALVEFIDVGDPKNDADR